MRLISVSSSRVSFTLHVPPRSHCASCPAQKNEFLQAVQVLVPRIRLFGTFLPDCDHESAGGSAICIHGDLLLDMALVTHSITCHGLDHLVNIRS